jgi:hypothetical protein
MKEFRAFGSVLAVAIFVGVVVLIGAVGRSANRPIAPGAVGSPEAPSEVAASSPVPPVGIGLACGQFTLDVLSIASTADELSKLADAVAIGTVVSIDEGHWATADGKGPSLEAGIRPTALDVYRIATVDIAAVAKSSQSAAVAGKTIEVRVVGGTIGCHTFGVSGEPELKPGTDVALFLMDKAQPNLAAAPFTGLDVIDAWPVFDGIAEGTTGSVTVDELMSVAAGSE